MPKSKEFISSESDSDLSDSEPKPKKKKVEQKKEKRREEDEESPKKKSGVKGGPEKGPGGELMFQLSKNRYATVSEFRGKVMVGIREYYEKDGDLRPGKKGISLPMDQWQRFKDLISDIDEAVKDVS